MVRLSISSGQEFIDFYRQQKDFSSNATQLQGVVIYGQDFGNSSIQPSPGNSFFKDVVFRNCVFGKLDLRVSLFTEVLFEGCVFRYNTILGSGAGITGGQVDMEFKSCMFKDSVTLRNTTTAKSGVVVSDCTFDKLATFDGSGLRVTSGKGNALWSIGVTDSTFTNIRAQSILLRESYRTMFHAMRVQESIRVPTHNTIYDCTLQFVTARALILDSAIVSNTNFWDCEFKKRDFRRSTLLQVDFHNSYITEKDLTTVAGQEDVNLY